MTDGLEFDPAWCRDLVRAALEEDLGDGDVTSRAVLPPELVVSAAAIAKDTGVIAGMPVAEMVFAEIDTSVVFQPLVTDGARVQPADRLAAVRGPAKSVLQGERTALNFLQRLSGIATLASRFAGIAGPHGVKVKDTRKTIPGLRALEKYAVRVGGCENHRMGLYDQILIKDNHLRCLPGGRIEASREAVRRAREAEPDVTVEVEAETLDEALAAAQAGADIVMLDNMTPEGVREAVAELGKMGEHRPIIEVSGGACLETLEEYAKAGPDWISAGMLTHSARALDISLEIEA
jgi:nicotinate-nucleotide pyrophosphorylase (carboxylating)